MMPVLALTAILALAVVSPVAADNVSIGVKIGVPAPPRVVVMPPPPPVVPVAPPKLVVVPGSPVFYAPGISINFFGLRRPLLQLPRGGVVCRDDTWRPVGDDCARSSAAASPRGSGRVLQDSSGAREEDGGPG